jgi:hypothetical protein
MKKSGVVPPSLLVLEVEAITVGGDFIQWIG